VYKTADRRARLALLAGLMDTDGSVSRTSYDFVTKSRRLAEDVAFVARSLGLCVPRVNERTAVCCNSPTRAVGTYYRLCISGETTVVPCLVPRKLPPMRTSKKDPLRTGFFVRRAGVQRYYGFTLDGDGRFLLGDFTVTHNSMCLSHAAATASYLGFSVAYATLELEVHEVWSRLIANMTGISINAVKDGSGEEVARQRMEVLSQRPLGPIVVKWFPGNLTTFGEIEVWVKKVKQEMQAAGRDLHLVCLDYVDRVKGAGDYAAAGEVMDAFRSKLVVQNSLWGLTASAAKAKEKHKRRKDEESGADSQNKSRVADTVITLNREEEEGVDDEFVEKAITYFVGKHRQGDARMSVGPLPTEMDVGRMCAVFREEGW
jgi:hypothetical protein